MGNPSAFPARAAYPAYPAHPADHASPFRAASRIRLSGFLTTKKLDFYAESGQIPCRDRCKSLLAQGFDAKLRAFPIKHGVCVAQSFPYLRPTVCFCV
jgi:hypothetical protein